MRRFWQLFCLALLCNLAFASSAVFAATLAGVVEKMHGQVQATSGASTKSLQEKSEVFEGDKVSTDAQGEALIRMTDGTVFALRPSTSFTVDQYHFENEDKNAQNNLLVRLFVGSMRTVTGLIGKRTPQKFALKTVTSTIGIRGTDFETSVLEKNTGDAQAGTYNKVYQGATFMENSLGNRVEIGANQAAFTPTDALQMAKQFGLLSKVPNVFTTGKYDNLLELLQNETMNRLNSELSSKLPIPSKVKDLLPKLDGWFK